MGKANEWYEKKITVVLNGKGAHGLLWALNKVMDTPEALKGSAIRKVIGRFISKLTKEVRLSNEAKA